MTRPCYNLYESTPINPYNPAPRPRPYPMSSTHHDEAPLGSGGRLTQEERRELLDLLSALLRSIHRLSSPQGIAVMDIDDRVRRDMLADEDLLRLREISRQAVEGA